MKAALIYPYVYIGCIAIHLYTQTINRSVIEYNVQLLSSSSKFQHFPNSHHQHKTTLYEIKCSMFIYNNMYTHHQREVCSLIFRFKVPTFAELNRQISSFRHLFSQSFQCIIIGHVRHIKAINSENAVPWLDFPAEMCCSSSLHASYEDSMIHSVSAVPDHGESQCTIASALDLKCHNVQCRSLRRFLWTHRLPVRRHIWRHLDPIQVLGSPLPG